MFKVKTKEERIKDILRCVREMDKRLQCYPWEFDPYFFEVGKTYTINQPPPKLIEDLDDRWSHEDRWSQPDVYEEGYRVSERQPHPKDVENCWSLPKMWIPPSNKERLTVLRSLFTDLSSKYKILHNDTKLYNLIGYINFELSEHYHLDEYGEVNPSEDLVKRLMDQYVLLLQLCLEDPKSENYKRIYENLTSWVWDEREPYQDYLIPHSSYRLRPRNPSECSEFKFEFVIYSLLDLIERYKIFQDDPKLFRIVEGVYSDIYWVNRCLSVNEDHVSGFDWDSLKKSFEDKYFILLHLCLGDPNSREYKELYSIVTEGVEGGEIKEEERNRRSPYDDNPGFLHTPKLITWFSQVSIRDSFRPTQDRLR